MRVVAVGAHPDDIELGCGATLARIAAAGGQVCMLVLTDGRLGPVAPGGREREQAAAVAALGAELRWVGFPDGRLRHGPELVKWIGEALEEIRPDLVFTHAVADSHQDHVAAAHATVAAARDHPQVLHYETPSTLNFAPTVFADADGWVEHKLEALRCHLSQVVGTTRIDLEAVEAQARFRGYQGRLRNAEAFEATRSLLALRPALAIAPAAAPALEPQSRVG